MLSIESGVLVQVLIGFAIILVLIFLLTWLMKKLNVVSGKIARQGEDPRLSIKEVIAVDHKRRLLLVRRDNVEHLLLIGGETDILVEHHIQPAPAQLQPALHPVPPQAQAPLPAATQQQPLAPVASAPSQPKPGAHIPPLAGPAGPAQHPAAAQHAVSGSRPMASPAPKIYSPEPPAGSHPLRASQQMHPAPIRKGPSIGQPAYNEPLRGEPAARDTRMPENLTPRDRVAPLSPPAIHPEQRHQQPVAPQQPAYGSSRENPAPEVDQKPQKSRPIASTKDTMPTDLEKNQTAPEEATQLKTSAAKSPEAPEAQEAMKAQREEQHQASASEEQKELAKETPDAIPAQPISPDQEGRSNKARKAEKQDIAAEETTPRSHSEHSEHHAPSEQNEAAKHEQKDEQADIASQEQEEKTAPEIAVEPSQEQPLKPLATSASYDDEINRLLNELSSEIKK
nr:flagellar biosynthetic protein FliO [uncultured Cohaesibacter sp.]